MVEPSTAINGFRKYGIVPLDPSVFSDMDFVAAEVMDIPFDIVSFDIPFDVERLVNMRVKVGWNI